MAAEIDRQWRALTALPEDRAAVGRAIRGPVPPSERCQCWSLTVSAAQERNRPRRVRLLELSGYDLRRRPPALVPGEQERITQMLNSRRELVRMTGQDYGYDLKAWREFLLAAGKERRCRQGGPEGSKRRRFSEVG